MKMNRRIFLGTAGAALAATSLPRSLGAETRKYKACIIADTKQGGYGHSMHMAFALRDDVAVVGLADPDEAGREKHGAECGAERLYADYQEMLEKEQPDLVVIAPRWTIHHKEYLLACADIGAHGFMEKPLSTDLAEADAMIEAIDAKDLRWSLAYNMRVTPTIAHVKAQIDAGLIGTFMEVRGRGKEDQRAGAEDLIVLGTHIFDMMHYFFGMAEWCKADVTHNGQPATWNDVREPSEPLGPIIGNRIHASYGMGNGTMAYFSSMRTRDGGPGHWGMDIYGAKGMILIRMDVAPHIKWLDDPTWTPGLTGKAWQDLPDMPEFEIKEERTERHKWLVDDLMDAIETGRRPVAGLHDGRIAQEMIQGVFQSWVEGGGPVKLPLEQRSHPLIKEADA